jgi:hypothetical protein
VVVIATKTTIHFESIEGEDTTEDKKIIRERNFRRIKRKLLIRNVIERKPRPKKNPLEQQ